MVRVVEDWNKLAREVCRYPFQFQLFHNSVIMWVLFLSFTYSFLSRFLFPSNHSVHNQTGSTCFKFRIHIQPSTSFVQASKYCVTVLLIFCLNFQKQNGITALTRLHSTTFQKTHSKALELPILVLLLNLEIHWKIWYAPNIFDWYILKYSYANKYWSSGLKGHNGWSQSSHQF